MQPPMCSLWTEPGGSRGTPNFDIVAIPSRCTTLDLDDTRAPWLNAGYIENSGAVAVAKAPDGNAKLTPLQAWYRRQPFPAGGAKSLETNTVLTALHLGDTLSWDTALANGGKKYSPLHWPRHSGLTLRSQRWSLMATRLGTSARWRCPRRSRLFATTALTV